MELWDAYDKNFEKIAGVTLVRGEPVPEGMFHLVCSVVVRHIDGAYLMMQRADGKRFGGGLWEVTAAGSALQGETPEEGALRELREETGITSGELRFLGRDRNEGIRNLYAQFLFVTDIEKAAVSLQIGETADYRWVTGEELMAMPQESMATPKDLLRQLIPALAE